MIRVEVKILIGVGRLFVDSGLDSVSWVLETMTFRDVVGLGVRAELGLGLL